MSIENNSGYGSMYGVVDSMRNMTSAMEQLLQFLPENFVWPTIATVSPFSVYLEWGHRDETTAGGERRGCVWIVAGPDGVVMNADFRPDWPDCGASGFDAETAAGWLRELTQNWEWDASRSGTGTSSSLRRADMGTRQG